MDLQKCRKCSSGFRCSKARETLCAVCEVASLPNPSNPQEVDDEFAQFAGEIYGAVDVKDMDINCQDMFHHKARLEKLIKSLDKSTNKKERTRSKREISRMLEEHEALEKRLAEMQNLMLKTALLPTLTTSSKSTTKATESSSSLICNNNDSSRAVGESLSRSNSNTSTITSVHRNGSIKIQEEPTPSNGPSRKKGDRNNNNKKVAEHLAKDEVDSSPNKTATPTNAINMTPPSAFVANTPESGSGALNTPIKAKMDSGDADDKTVQISPVKQAAAFFEKTAAAKRASPVTVASPLSASAKEVSPSRPRKSITMEGIKPLETLREGQSVTTTTATVLPTPIAITPIPSHNHSSNFNSISKEGTTKAYSLSSKQKEQSDLSRDFTDSFDDDSDDPPPVALGRSNSVKNRIQAFEELSRRASTGSWDRNPGAKRRLQFTT